MSILLNGAGASASDPILKGLGLEWIIAASTMDVATLTDAWIDSAAGFAGTNSIKASLSPAATVNTSGNNGAYNDTTKELNIGSNTGLSVGDYLYLSHASITAGIYKIASLPAGGTSVTFVSNPFNGGGNKTGVSFQVAWRFNGVAGTAPISSSGAGAQNFFKSQAADSAANSAQLSDTAYIRDPLAGSAYISIAGNSYTGATINSAAPAFNLLSAWANRGGVSHVELTTHSVQTANQDFLWGDGSRAEKTLAAAIASGFTFTAGEGLKYGRLLLKSKAGGAVLVGVDIDVRLDTTGPALVFTLTGR